MAEKIKLRERRNKIEMKNNLEEVNFLKNEKLNKNQGITLIALVVTIVVLLILASVSITVILGDNGLIEMAREAANKTNEAVKKDLDDIQNITDELNNFVNPSNPTPPDQADEPEELSTLAEAAANETVSDTNQNLEDEYGNKVVVPAGFKVLKHGESNVEYNYSTAHPQTPTVQDGVVIEDVKAGGTGNQFVWIPVGSINNKEGESTTITLGRYEKFADNEQPKTDGSVIYVDLGILGNTDCIEETYSEHQTSGKTNTIAKDIDVFKSSANTNGGYYLARYEASNGSSDKAESKENVTPWNNITQPAAATAAQSMYDSSNFTSDLTNSYAWDTAIVFIQKYSDNKTYSKQDSKNTTSKGGLGNTGERKGDTDTTDKVCNIYDMASNCYEWTTETSIRKYDGVTRGGAIYNDYPRAGTRMFGNTLNGVGSTAFRPVLYVNQQY